MGIFLFLLIPLLQSFPTCSRRKRIYINDFIFFFYFFFKYVCVCVCVACVCGTLFCDIRLCLNKVIPVQLCRFYFQKRTPQTAKVRRSCFSVFSILSCFVHFHSSRICLIGVSLYPGCRGKAFSFFSFSSLSFSF